MTRYGQTFSAAECDEMFRDADANGDGSIDFDEFLGMMMEDQVGFGHQIFKFIFGGKFKPHFLQGNVNYQQPSLDCGIK